MRNYLIIIILALLAFSCGNPENSFKKASTGLEYRFVTMHEEAAVTKIDNVLVLTMDIYTESGDKIFSTKDLERKYLIKLHEPQHPGGSIEDALAMMHLGDSAIFRIDAYNYYTYSEKLERLPGKVKKGDKIVLRIRLDEILLSGTYDDVVVEKYHKDEATEMKLLEEYLMRTNVTTKPLSSGLYYIELEKGNGAKAVNGKKVKVHYTGSFIDGNVFETSLDTKPIEFVLGNNQVIQGWEQGIAMMNEGGKARFIIPSKLAYGATGQDNILPFSTLIFEVELVSVK